MRRSVYLTAHAFAVVSRQLKSDLQLQSLVHTYIYNAMLYHMDSSVRDKILKQKLPEVKPDQLPGSMADDLDQHAKDWFHDTYGPAYVSNAISQADPENLATWRNKLSEDDRLKVRYWFSGRVSNVPL